LGKKKHPALQDAFLSYENKLMFLIPKTEKPGFVEAFLINLSNLTSKIC